MSAGGGTKGQGTKFPGETIPVTFDFTSVLGVSETISTQSIGATVYSGVDSNPALIVDGPASASGKIVTQSIEAGVAGVVYQLLCTITTSMARTFQQSSYLAVVPALT